MKQTSLFQVFEVGTQHGGFCRVDTLKKDILLELGSASCRSHFSQLNGQMSAPHPLPGRVHDDL